MKISEHTIKFLGNTLCGNTDILPYKKGYELVSFFNQFGANDVYESGIPARWEYTENKLHQFNNTDQLNLIIEKSVDPRPFIGEGLDLEVAIEKINEILKFDGYVLKQKGEFYKVYDISNKLIEPDSLRKLDQVFIREQIEKCNSKISHGDYNGAVTNARSLVEAVMIEIIENHKGIEIKNSGKLDNLYKQVKKILNLSIDPNLYPPTVIQILSGLDSIVSGLAGLSNNSGDRHANKFKTSKHHAKLAVNASLTLVEFLLDSKDYQNEKSI